MVEKYALSNCKLLYSLSYCFNNPGWFVPRINWCTWSHVPFHDIRGTDATSTQLDKQFAWPNFWHREINDPYIIVSMIFNNTHYLSPFSRHYAKEAKWLFAQSKKLVDLMA